VHNTQRTASQVSHYRIKEHWKEGGIQCHNQQFFKKPVSFVTYEWAKRTDHCSQLVPGEIQQEVNSQQGERVFSWQLNESNGLKNSNE
jgi:hypothetical protein